MKIIFLKDVPKMGHRYEVKDMADGYARNFLLPRNLAVIATDSEMKRLAALRTAAEEDAQVRTDLLEKAFSHMSEYSLVFTRKANEKGNLFDAVDRREIALKLEAEHHIALDPEHFDIAKPLKTIGDHDVPLEVNGKKAILKVIIEKE